jgi:hypothetical protein
MKNDAKSKSHTTAAAQVNRPQHNLGKITKTFQQDGRWIEKTKKTEILLCVCGNRYIKTRPKQMVCLRCLSALNR